MKGYKRKKHSMLILTLFTSLLAVAISVQTANAWESSSSGSNDYYIDGPCNHDEDLDGKDDHGDSDNDGICDGDDDDYSFTCKKSKCFRSNQLCK